MFPQTATMTGVAFCDERFDAALSQRFADFFLGVVRPVAKGFVWTLSSSTAGTFDRWDRVDQRDGLLGVVNVCSRVGHRQRGALAIAHNMPFRAIFAAIRGIGAGLRPPKTARTEQLSKITLSQSIVSASPNSSSRICQTFFHTPASCQSRSRRQQVIPQPHPSSWGKYSQGQPVRATNNTPVSAARSGTRGRPPLGLGLCGGSKGSMRDHNSSVSSGLAISGSSLNAKRLPKPPAHANRFC
jgi:hypothetical protein